MRFLLPLAILLSLALPAPAAAQSPDTIRGTDFEVPEALAGFSLEKVTDFDDPANGSAMRYRGPRGLRVDVYLYPVPPLEGCAAGCDSVAVREEADGFARMIPLLIERGYFDALRVEVDEPVQAGDLRGRHLRLAGEQEGEPRTSQFYLLGAGDLLVKARSTYAPDPATDAAVAELVAALAERAAGVRRVEPTTLSLTPPAGSPASAPR